MSRYIVSDERIPIYEFDASAVISDRLPNVIYIKSRMDLATQAAVQSELMTMSADGKTLESHLGVGQLALLLNNIVRWAGPDLDSIPCTPANIRRLDPNEPHLVLVLEEIQRRNLRAESPLPNAPGVPMSENVGAPALTASQGSDPQLATWDSLISK